MHLRCEILTPEMFSLVCAVFVRRFEDIEDRIGMICGRGDVWRYSLGFDVAQWPTHSAAEAGGFKDMLRLLCVKWRSPENQCYDIKSLSSRTYDVHTYSVSEWQVNGHGASQ